MSQSEKVEKQTEKCEIVYFAIKPLFQQIAYTSLFSHFSCPIIILISEKAD